MLKEVAEKVESFNHITLKYWAFATDWRRRLLLDSSTPKPKVLLDAERDIFNSFSELTNAEALLLLFGYENAQIALRNYGESVVTFRKRVLSLDIAFNENDAATYRESMIQERAELFKLLNEIYKTI